MGNREAHGDTTGDKRESRQDPHRLDDARSIQNLSARVPMNDGDDSAAEVRTHHDPESIVLQCDEPVALEYRFRGGRDIADVGIDTIGIERGRDRTSRRKLMREDVILKFRTDNGLIAQVGRSTPPACAGPCGQLLLFSSDRNSVCCSRERRLRYTKERSGLAAGVPTLEPSGA